VTVILTTRVLRPPQAANSHIPWRANRMPSTQRLAGTTLRLLPEDGEAQDWAFDQETVKGGPQGAQPYDAVELRPSIFLIDLPDLSARQATTVLACLDTGVGIVVANELIDHHGRTELRQTIQSCRFDGWAGASPLARTREMIGLRVAAEYAPTIAVEQIYLSSTRIAWQSLAKDEFTANAEADHATFWRVADDLYLVTWVEELRPLGAVLLTDLAAGCNVGKLFGADDLGLLNELCGAKLSVLGRTHYPPSRQPALSGPLPLTRPPRTLKEIASARTALCPA
jgi:hypothetical protein